MQDLHTDLYKHFSVMVFSRGKKLNSEKMRFFKEYFLYFSYLKDCLMQLVVSKTENIVLI